MNRPTTTLTGSPARDQPSAPRPSAAEERVAGILDSDFATTAVRRSHPVEALEVLLASEGDWHRVARLDPAHPIPRETFERHAPSEFHDV